MLLKDAIKKAAGYAMSEKEGGINKMDTIQVKKNLVTAHDFKSGIAIVVSDAPEGSNFAIPAKRAWRAVRSCGENVKYNLTPTGITIKGDSGKFHLSTLNLSTIPTMTTPTKGIKWVKLAECDYRAIGRVMWSKADKSRMTLSGVWITSDRICAINGHTFCHIKTSENILEKLGLSEPVSFIPESLLDLGETVELALENEGRGKIFLTNTKDEIRMSSCVYPATLPPIGTILKDGKTFPEIEIKRDVFLETIMRAKISTDRDQKPIKMEMNKEGVKFSSCDQLNEFRFEHILPAKISEPVHGNVNLNGDYLQYALECSESEYIIIKCKWDEKGSVDPVLVIGDNAESVIMPMRF
jgi:hypothetical protein